MCRKEEETPIVTYVTRVSLSLEIDPDEFAALRTDVDITPDSIRLLGCKMAQRAERVAALMEFLANKGFLLRREKKAVYAYSNAVEAQEIKRCMLAAGFKDREFQVLLEYTRGWGML